MDISIIAHASVLVRMGSVASRIRAAPCFNPPRALDVDALLARTTLLAITHIHLDHFHPETLSRFSRDLPVLAPPHRPLISAIRELGFNRVIELAPWQSHPAGEGWLTATPSDFELDEFGLVFCHGEDRYWHMSDAIVTAEVGRRVHAEFGAMSVTAVRYQPVRTLVAYQRGLQSTRLDRD